MSSAEHLQHREQDLIDGIDRGERTETQPEMGTDFGDRGRRAAHDGTVEARDETESLVEARVGVDGCAECGTYRVDGASIIRVRATGGPDVGRWGDADFDAGGRFTTDPPRPRPCCDPRPPCEVAA